LEWIKLDTAAQTTQQKEMGNQQTATTLTEKQTIHNYLNGHTTMVVQSNSQLVIAASGRKHKLSTLRRLGKQHSHHHHKHSKLTTKTAQQETIEKIVQFKQLHCINQEEPVVFKSATTPVAPTSLMPAYEEEEDWTDEGSEMSLSEDDEHTLSIITSTCSHSDRVHSGDVDGEEVANLFIPNHAMSYQDYSIWYLKESVRMTIDDLIEHQT